MFRRRFANNFRRSKMEWREWTRRSKIKNKIIWKFYRKVFRKMPVRFKWEIQLKRCSIIVCSEDFRHYFHWSNFWNFILVLESLEAGETFIWPRFGHILTPFRKKIDLNWKIGQKSSILIILKFRKNEFRRPRTIVIGILLINITYFIKNFTLWRYLVVSVSFWKSDFRKSQNLRNTRR